MMLVKVSDPGNVFLTVFSQGQHTKARALSICRTHTHTSSVGKPKVRKSW